MRTMQAGGQTIIVIGAGIIGVSTALNLQRMGHQVTIFDPNGPAGGASAGNGGAMAASGILPLNTPGIVGRGLKMLADPKQPLFIKWRYLPKIFPWLVRFASHATPEKTERTAMALASLVMTSWSDHAALAAGTPAERYLKQTDYAFLYPSRAAYEGDAFGFALKRKAGIAWHILEGDALRAYDPSLAQSDGFLVVYDGAEHAVLTDPKRYVEGLAEGFETLGGRIIRAAVDDIRVEPTADGRKRANGVLTGGAFHACDSVLLAAGAWSKDLAVKLGLDLPLETERGYHLELWEPNVEMKRSILVTQGKFVVTPMEGRLRCAGIDEFGGLDAGPSPQGPALLEHWLRRTMPAITWSRSSTWLGFRPTLPDSLPVIGGTPGIANAFVSFGHHHLGMTAGPKTGRLLAAMMTGATINEDVAAFDPGKWA
jgi:D-amino-acid dehydrogenase